MSWPALVAWLGSVALAVVAWQSGWIHLFFLALPVWVLTAVVYTALSAVAGARERAAGRGRPGRRRRRRTPPPRPTRPPRARPRGPWRAW